MPTAPNQSALGQTASDQSAPDQEARSNAPADMTLPTSRVARLLSLPIVAYRRWVSPALPARCRFHPSCSAYALTAIATHGPVRGLGLAIWRLLRCHPFHPGGYDPVPPPRSRPRRNDDATGAVTS
jgi:putative membrane protein insertion efficiency factor